jgi:hypothetical protein
MNMPLTKRATLVAAVSALTLAIGSTNALAIQAGDLDPTFGTGGLSSLISPTNYGYGTSDMAVQPDGKILTAGHEQFMSGFTAIAVQRFNADGSLDLSFGGGDGVASVQPAVSNSSSALQRMPWKSHPTAASSSVDIAWCRTRRINRSL